MTCVRAWEASTASDSYSFALHVTQTLGSILAPLIASQDPPPPILDPPSRRRRSEASVKRQIQESAVQTTRRLRTVGMRTEASVKRQIQESAVQTTRRLRAIRNENRGIGQTTDSGVSSPNNETTTNSGNENRIASVSLCNGIVGQNETGLVNCSEAGSDYFNVTNSNVVTNGNVVTSGNVVTNSDVTTNSNVVTKSDVTTNSNVVTKSDVTTNSNVVTKSDVTTNSNVVTKSDVTTNSNVVTKSNVVYENCTYYFIEQNCTDSEDQNCTISEQQKLE